ncbi:hypothetical protein [Endothiovibrio diazotrophicus]
MEQWRTEARGAALFAAPTVLDQPFYNVYHPAPPGVQWGLRSISVSRVDALRWRS